MIPAEYRKGPNQINKSITGGWIEVSVVHDTAYGTTTLFSGELIAFQDDTLHILTPGNGLITLYKNRIIKANLYVFAYPGLPLAGFLGLIPNLYGFVSGGEYAGGFLLIGIPLFVQSLIMAIVDQNKSNSTLRYPGKNTLDEFSGYARFPQGLPPDLIKEKLHLVFREN